MICYSYKIFISSYTRWLIHQTWPCVVKNCVYMERFASTVISYGNSVSKNGNKIPRRDGVFVTHKMTYYPSKCPKRHCVMTFVYVFDVMWIKIYYHHIVEIGLEFRLICLHTNSCRLSVSLIRRRIFAKFHMGTLEWHECCKYYYDKTTSPHWIYYM